MAARTSRPCSTKSVDEWRRRPKKAERVENKDSVPSASSIGTVGLPDVPAAREQGDEGALPSIYVLLITTRYLVFWYSVYRCIIFY